MNYPETSHDTSLYHISVVGRYRGAFTFAYYHSEKIKKSKNGSTAIKRRF
nr:MAG TPA: hypothetical protein [Bacteriophage sp.]DAU13171.1 MAG TPA: hypothetical protein [Caudoviricetes sp.]